MPIAKMPPAEVSIEAGLVRTLVIAQFPDYAKLPIRPVAGVGWDNSLYRLGSDHRRQVTRGSLQPCSALFSTSDPR